MLDWLARTFEKKRAALHDTLQQSVSAGAPVTLQKEHPEWRELGSKALDDNERTALTKKCLLHFLETARTEGKVVAALGASTKGNVLLQYCGITEQLIKFVAEVNPEKFACYTPGSWLPIVPEQQLIDSKPDYVLVLPWHFRKFFITNKKFSGMNLIFPLPELEVIRVS